MSERSKRFLQEKGIITTGEVLVHDTRDNTVHKLDELLDEYGGEPSSHRLERFGIWLEVMRCMGDCRSIEELTEEFLTKK